MLPRCNTYDPWQLSSQQDMCNSAVSSTHMLMQSMAVQLYLSPFTNMDIMPDTGSIANFLGLVRSWTLEKNLLGTLC